MSLSKRWSPSEREKAFADIRALHIACGDDQFEIECELTCQRNALLAELRSVSLSLNMTRLIMDDTESRADAEQIVADAQALIRKCEAL